MILEDLQASELLIARNSIQPKTVCLLSPTQEIEFYENLFPNAKIFTKNISNWDLNEKCEDHFDLIVAHNVFHYSNDPSLWLKNVMNSCGVFLMQDLLVRPRGRNGSQFCDDGDKTRYSFGNVKLFDGPTFDLSLENVRIFDIVIYSGGSCESRHFVCLVR